MIVQLDWSRNYINKQVNRIRAMFKWASANEILDATVAATLRELGGLKKGRTKARETPRVKVVSDTVVEATLKSLPAVVADMVRVQRLTSARPGEICSMAPETSIDPRTSGSTVRSNIKRSTSTRIESSRSAHEPKRSFLNMSPEGKRSRFASRLRSRS